MITNVLPRFYGSQCIYRATVCLWCIFLPSSSSSTLDSAPLAYDIALIVWCHSVLSCTEYLSLCRWAMHQSTVLLLTALCVAVLLCYYCSLCQNQWLDLQTAILCMIKHWHIIIYYYYFHFVTVYDDDDICIAKVWATIHLFFHLFSPSLSSSQFQYLP